MNNIATEKMLLAVRSAKESAEKASQKHREANSEIQKKSRRDIALFGGDATSRVMELASDVRKANDELYAANQTLIVMLDMQCRPILAENPSVEAVNEVQKLIVQLNKDSEIGSTFTASLNGKTLGDVASASYVPKLENKMIQKFWEQTFDNMPGSKEIKLKEEKLKEDKLKTEELVQKMIKESRNKTTLFNDNEKDASDDGTDDHRKQIKELENEVQNHIVSLTAELKNINVEKSHKEEKINQKIELLKQERKNAGFFGMKQKKAIDEQINNLLKEKELAVAEANKKESQVEAQLSLWKRYKSVVSPQQGDTLLFGRDPLSEEEIRWIVAEVTAEYVALLSCDILGYATFKSGWRNENQSYVDWLKDFENKAFSKTQKEGLLKAPFDYYDCPSYAFVFTSKDAREFPREWLPAEPTAALLKSIEDDDKLSDSDKRGHINVVKSSYWLHSRDDWNELRLCRVKLNDSGVWEIDIKNKVTNDSFPSGVRPVIMVNRMFLAQQVLTKIDA